MQRVSNQIKSSSQANRQAPRNEKSPKILEEAAVVVSTRQCVVSINGCLHDGEAQSQAVKNKRFGERKLAASIGMVPPRQPPIHEQCRGMIRAAEQQRVRNLGSRDMNSSSSRQSNARISLVRIRLDPFVKHQGIGFFQVKRKKKKIPLQFQTSGSTGKCDDLIRKRVRTSWMKIEAQAVQ